MRMGFREVRVVRLTLNHEIDIPRHSRDGVHRKPWSQ